MELIKNYFGGIGNINKQSKDSLQYSVTSQKDFNVIIHHLNKYTLLTQKKADFILFEKVVNLINRKEHLTIEGLQKIVAIKASLNLGLSDELKLAFPNIVPVNKPVILDQNIRDPHWVAGFSTGEGCFFIRLSRNPAKPKAQVQLVFSIGQHDRDKILMNSLVSYFGCGRYVALNNKNLGGEFVVTKLEDIINIIIPFFDKYKIVGSKGEDFEYFKQVSILMKNKAHLTSKGLDEIRLIKKCMKREIK